MQATTWIDRITDESTLWLNAVRSEDQRDFVQAASLYLRDASVSLGHGSLVRGAQSCACAADCLNEAGLSTYAKLLYRESAKIYLERADEIGRTSVREMLWSLRQSNQYFWMAEDREMTKETYTRMLAVSRRIDPFSVDAPSLMPQGTGPIRRRNEADKAALRGTEITAEVERFLRSRETGQYEVGGSVPSRASTAPKAGRAQTNEKSIINQLG